MTNGNVLEVVPARHGHFALESGYHTDVWRTLDALFVDQASIRPFVVALADRLRSHSVSAVCGPLRGGAFLAQALAGVLGARFYYGEPGPAPARPGLFQATYRLRPELAERARGERMAVVDDVISAGSSVRATVAALVAAGASVAVVGALAVLGRRAVEDFAAAGVPLETLASHPLTLWRPADCPLCQAGQPLEHPAG